MSSHDDQPSAVNLNHLAVRLQGMEGDVELTPAYRAWREAATAELRAAQAEKEAKQEHIARRLGNQALEEQ